MKKEDLNKVREIVNKAYQEVNCLMSNHDLELLDLVYPNHDGVQDADAASDMMLLRQDANSLATACNILTVKLTNVIGDDDELAE